jgi:hypothetical protein
LSVVTDASDLPVTDSDGECCGGMTIFAPWSWVPMLWTYISIITHGKS